MDKFGHMLYEMGTRSARFWRANKTHLYEVKYLLGPDVGIRIYAYVYTHAHDVWVLL